MNFAAFMIVFIVVPLLVLLLIGVKGVIDDLQNTRRICYETWKIVSALQIDLGSRGRFRREYDVDDVREK